MCDNMEVPLIGIRKIENLFCLDLLREETPLNRYSKGLHSKLEAKYGVKGIFGNTIWS